MRTARALLSADALEGWLRFDCHIDVEDEAGAVVHSLAFQNAVEIVTTRRRRQQRSASDPPTSPGRGRRANSGVKQSLILRRPDLGEGLVME